MRVFISGWGAVTPAGWGVAALSEALDQGEPLPTQPLNRPGWENSVRARVVPNPVARPDFLAHPRLRRSSPITHYAAAAALEALGSLRSGPNRAGRLGIVVCLQAGCVNYSCRFLDETLNNPSTASPLLFPETVYAAPASHIAALLGSPGPGSTGAPGQSATEVSLAYTLVGDPASFLQGVTIGGDWLAQGRVDACLVIGAEEINWILADALWHLDRSAVITGGAGALCLSSDQQFRSGIELAAITDAHTYTARHGRRQAAQAMRGQLGEGGSAELLCDGLGERSRADAAEAAAWRDWTGPRLSLKRVLGEGLMASAAWQCVAACEAVRNGRFAAATVSLVGSNQQAIGARFVRASKRASV